MKKLLTIFVLALVLCFACTSALAAHSVDADGNQIHTYKYDLTGTYKTYFDTDATQDGIIHIFCDDAGADENDFVSAVIHSTHKEHTFPTLTAENLGTYVVIVKAATCTEDAVLAVKCTGVQDPLGEVHLGSRTGENPNYYYGCRACGKYQTVSSETVKALNAAWYNTNVKAKNHTPHLTKITKTPTCTEKGVGEYECTVCKVNLGEMDIPALNHKKADGTWAIATPVTISDATCTNYAVKYGKCSLCNKNVTYSDDIAGLDTENHNWSDWITFKEATCENKPVQYRICKDCFDAKDWRKEADTPTVKHSWTYTVVTAPTCAATGVASKAVCSKCKLEVTVSGGAYVKNPATSTATQLPAISGTSGLEIPVDPDAHPTDPTKWTVVTTDPTCTDKGKTVSTCSVCGKEVVAVLAAKGHDYQLRYSLAGKTDFADFGKYAAVVTCKEIAGKQQKFQSALVCVNGCKDVKKDSITAIETPAHEYGEWKTLNEPNRAKEIPGSWYRECKNCPKIDHVQGYEDPRHTEHDYKVTKTVAAECEKAGYVEKTCSVCGNVITEEIKALEHKFGEWTVTKAATKEADGEEQRKCELCGKVETRVKKYEVTAAPKYSVTGLTYDGQTLKGKLAHDEDTLEAETLNVRVTFFMTGNYYMATIGEVAADGSFSVDGVGPIEYISVVATGSSSVNPDDVVALGSGEITVK